MSAEVHNIRKTQTAFTAEKCAAAAVDRAEQLTMALHNLTRMQSMKPARNGNKPAEQTLGNVTLALLRVDGIKDEVQDETIREKLHLAAGILEFCKSALEAQLARKVALQALIVPDLELETA